MEGPDHFYALEPNEFKLYVKELRSSLKCIGSEKIFLKKKDCTVEEKVCILKEI